MQTLDENATRARTESLFREVNERIAENAQQFEAGSTAFVCECADPQCTERVEATLAEYEQVREDGATFMLAPGHADTDIERVIQDRVRYQTVEKMQKTAREIVRRLNPRRNSV